MKLESLIAVVSAGALLIWWFARRLTDEKRGEENRRIVHGWVKGQGLLSRYHRLLDTLVDGLHDFYGDSRSWTAFGTSLTLSCLYPVLFFVFAYGLGGTNSLGGTELLPHTGQARWQWPLGLCTLLLLEGVLIKNRKSVDRWCVERLRHARWPGLAQGVLFSGLLVGAASMASTVIFQAALGAAVGACWTRRSFSLAMAVTVALVVASQFPAVLAGLSGLAIAGSVGVFAALAAAFAVGLIGWIAGAVTRASENEVGIIVANVGAGMVDGARLIGRFLSATTFRSLVGPVFLVFGALLVGTREADPVVGVLYIGLPLVNALFDWASLRVSRHFINEARRATSWWGPARDVFFDIVLAFVFMFALAAVLPSTVDAINELSGPGKGDVDWRPIADSARDAPWSRGLMVTLMLVTTLVPTVLHLMVGLTATLMQLWKVGNLAEHVERMNSPDWKENDGQPLWVAFWILAYPLGAAAIGCGLYGLFGMVANWPFPNWLYYLANWVHDPWLLALLLPLAIAARFDLGREPRNGSTTGLNRGG